MNVPVTIRLAFATSRSHDFPWMLERARLGRYEAITIEGCQAHQTIFTLPCEPVELFACEELASLLKHRKGFAWVNGQPIDPLRLASVLRCYSHSLLVSDVRAHCWRRPLIRPLSISLEDALDDLVMAKIHAETPRPEPPMFPCQLALSWVRGAISRVNPASYRAQVEAVLVERDCHWCPSLRLDDWESRHG